MATIDQLGQLLGAIYDDAREGLRGGSDRAGYEARRDEFTFHLRDCADDLARLADFLKDPGEVDAEDAAALVVGALYHVIPHLNAAGRLLLDEVPDPFSDAGGG